MGPPTPPNGRMAAMTTLFVAAGVLARYGINRLALHGGSLLWSTVVGGILAASAGYAMVAACDDRS